MSGSGSELVVGVVGLGAMGGGIARRLRSAGCDIIGFDIEPSRRDAVDAEGIQTARSMAELADRVDVVLTSLPNTEAVRDVVLGPEGLIGVSDRRVGAVIEMSTIHPDVWRDISATCVSRGLRCLDAPVTGGPGEARSGGLRIFVGGDDDLIGRWSELLAVLGEVVPVGGTGAGHVVKVVNNLMSMANVAVAAEGMALGVSAGLEPSRLFEALAGGGGRSHHFLKRFPKVIAGDLSPGFSLTLCLKDLGIARDLAASTGLALRLTPAAYAAYEMTKELGYGDLDFAAVVRLYEDEAGIEISPRTQAADGHAVRNR